MAPQKSGISVMEKQSSEFLSTAQKHNQFKSVTESKKNDEKSLLANLFFENCTPLYKERILPLNAKVRELFWDASSSNYNYLMDDGLSSTYGDESSDLSLDDERETLKTADLGVFSFIEQYKRLYDLLHNTQVAKENGSDNSSSKIFKEQQKVAYLCKSFNDQALRISKEHPDMRKDVHRHLNRLNNKWKVVEQSIKVKSPSKDSVCDEIRHLIKIKLLDAPQELKIEKVKMVPQKSGISVMEKQSCEFQSTAQKNKQFKSVVESEENENSQLKDQLLAVSQKLETERDRLKSEISSMERKIRELESAEKDNTQLKSVVETKENENSQLKDELLAVCQKLEQLKSEISIMEKKICELQSTEQDNIQLKSVIETKESENSQLKDQLLAVSEELEREKNERQHVKSENSIMEKRIHDLQSTVREIIRLNSVTEKEIENGGSEEGVSSTSSDSSDDEEAESRQPQSDGLCLVQ